MTVLNPIVLINNNIKIYNLLPKHISFNKSALLELEKRIKSTGRLLGEIYLHDPDRRGLTLVTLNYLKKGNHEPSMRTIDLLYTTAIANG